MTIMDKFTKRQREIARLLSQGLTQQQIAHRLGIRPGTVYKHSENMRRRAGVNSTTTIAIKAMTEGR